MRFLLKAPFLVAISSACLFGQPASLHVSASPSASTVHITAPPPLGRALAGAPYSGEQVSEHIQTLADGTHITQKEDLVKVFRDSLGRTREEAPLFRRNMALAGPAADARIVVSITDPVAQVRYTLDTVNKVAHRQRLPSPAARPAQPAIGKVTPPPLENRPQVSHENLGTQTIEGVLAEGTRTTMTFPVDSQGNDHPISVVNETWMSPELHVMILSKFSDPRSGENVQRLIDISRDEPSASLFQPPPEYTVVDEEAPFTLKWDAQ